jgi:site-specific DNA recombinase
LYWVAKTLSEQQIPALGGGPRWNVATVRGILRSPTYAGTAHSGRTHPIPAHQRKSALLPVGRGQSIKPAPADEWIAERVPAIVSQETFELAQRRLEQNKQMARRNNSTHDYLLRGLVTVVSLIFSVRFANSVRNFAQHLRANIASRNPSRIS